MKHITVPATCFTLLVLGCSSPHELHVEEGTFTVTHPLRRDTVLEREYVAQVHAIRHIEIRALQEGYLQDIFVDEGRLITEGDKMFQTMPLIYQAEVNKAEAETELARIEYENTRSLADKAIVSATELALAKARLNKAVASQSLAEAHRQLALIRAPFTGLMDRFRVRKGSLLEPGELLTTLSDNSTLWIYFNVNEREYLEYLARPASERAAPVKFVMANNELFDQAGKVDAIEADFNSETGNIAFRAAFPNPHRKLRHGQTGKVRLSFPVKDALLIPQKSTFEIMDRRYVYAVDKDGTARARAISLLGELPNVFLVAKGLEESDTVIVDGIRKVHEGQKVKVSLQQASEVLSRLEVPAE